MKTTGMLAAVITGMAAIGISQGSVGAEVPRGFSGQAASLHTELRGFLGRAYNLKAIAAYETGAGAHVPPDAARTAIATAGDWSTALAAPLPPNGNQPKS